MPTIKKDSKTVYVCGVDWQCEIGEASDGNKIYPSPQNLKKYGHGNSGCGIVECTISFNRWVEKQDYEEMRRNSVPAAEMPRLQLQAVEEKIAALQKFRSRLKKEIKSNPKAKTKSGRRNRS